MDQIHRLGKFRAGRIAVHLHFSELSQAYRNESFIRIATDSFATFVTGFEGHLYKLDNDDIFFITKDVTESVLEAIVDRVKLLFSQEPLLETRTVTGKSRFCTYYSLEDEYDDLLITVSELLKEANIRRGLFASADETIPAPPKPVSPDILARLESSLETVDVTNLARRQTVCTLVDDITPQPLFEEIYVSIADLQQIVAPGIDLSSNPWLFRYLTQTLDQRLMLMLMRDGVTSSRPFSLNLNVASILTPEFARFEKIITPQLRGRLVIEMNTLDVFSDMNAFLFAKDYLHDHGFRLCLDGLNHHTLPYYSRTQLGFDLVKLNWTPNALDSMLPSIMPEIRNLIMETGQAHTILCRCDNEKAVATGQDLGIVMFQGRQIDKLLAAARIPAPSSF